ncbi:hypothetical protein [Candidatus Oscillochloris fontis]|uniref:hypothetical protein n=1 Tax=Candidatus Oscillochloris fontis TaxID=2496868 RepID=UPI00101D17A3|nr:hypothetical protein [Candidatus Oscillochloris fontis]
MNDKKIDQSHHSGSNSAGAGNHFAGPVQIGNTVHGPVIHGGVQSGGDTYIAGGDQTIHHADRDAPEVAAPPPTPPSLRLSASQEGDGDHLEVGAEALVHLELTAPTHADAITLFFARGGETVRLVLLERGQSWDVPLPLTDHDLASLTQRAHTTLRDLILHQPGRALSGTLRIAPVVRDATLRRLADVGAGLWTGLFHPHGASSDLHDLRAHLAARSQRGPLQITIVGHRVALPWQLLFVGQPDPAIRADSFWGLRHELAVQPLQGRRRASTLTPAASAPRTALLAFNLGIDDQVKLPVIAPQRAALAVLGLRIHEVTTEAGLRDALSSGSDAALVYLYGHMRSPLRRPSGPTVDIDQMEIELTSPAQAISLEELRRVAAVEHEARLRAGPLVLINACSSGEQTPLSFGGLVPYLLDLGAQAVIGTAVETPIHFAAAFGPDVIGRVFGAGQPVGAALLAARSSALEQHDNPLGLLYELFGNATVRG